MLKESDLNSYQLDALDFLERKGSALLALDLGLGKSVISATYNRRLLCTTKALHCLIVAPKKVALNTWPDELSKWEHLKDFTVSQMTGLDPAGRAVAARSLKDFNIINRENLMWLINFWKKEWPYDSIILDEAKWCCTGSTFKQLRKVRKYIEYVTLLSGTPAPNGHMDLFGMAWMCNQGESLGTHISHYRSKYFNRHPMGFGYKIKNKEVEREINEKMQDIALYMAVDDHLDLPPFVPRMTMVTLPDKMWSDYERFKDDFIMEVSGGVIVADSSAILSNKLLQFCSGNVYDEERNVHHFHTVKLDMLEEIVKNTESPILCAYGYRHELPGLKSRFPKAEFMSNDTNVVKRWNQGKIPLLFCHPASASMGLNLQYGGNVLIWFSLTYNLEHYQQFNYRLRRRGQKAGSVVINHIVVKDTLEERLIESLNKKGITQQELLDSLRLK